MTAKPTTIYEVSRPTAREILVRAGGDAHALHSVVSKEPDGRGTVRVHCSCGSSFRVLADEESKIALRNVPMAAPFSAFVRHPLSSGWRFDAMLPGQVWRLTLRTERDLDGFRCRFDGLMVSTGATEPVDLTVES